MPTDPKQEETLFAAALNLPAGERAAFLDQECAGDRSLRQRVESLLAAHAQAGTFIDQPAGGQETVLVNIGDLLPRSERGGEHVGRYKLLEKIGEGGFGDVWMAEQEEPVRRRVALKIIKLGMDTREVVARFEAERQALALMDHPNIARVFDGGATDSGRPFFVMELVRGIPITRFCDEQKLSTNERLELFMQVCAAVQHAHQKGVIHRDLKPSNILVGIQDDRPVAKVIDFGIAKAMEAHLTEKTLFTRFQQIIGTPEYMSPEQAGLGGLDIDTRSDIYSLGVLLYELLTGRTPFDAGRLWAEGYEAILRTIREVDPPKPSTRLSTLNAEDLRDIAAKRGAEPQKLNRLVRGDLDWIVMKCMEKDRARRYDTANALAMDLKRCLGGEPVVARPPSNVYRFQKLLKRNKALFASATVVALALMSGAIVSLWQAARATRFARESNHQRQVATNEAARATTLLEKSEHALKENERLLYVANMNQIQQAWDQKDIGRVRELLKDTEDYPAKRFEWFLWQSQIHLAEKTLYGHSAGVNSIAYSRDGLRIVSGSHDGTAKVWDVATGRVLLTLEGHYRYVSCVAFSPEGRRIVAGSFNTTAIVWDAFSGQKLLTLGGHIGPINEVAFSSDGQRIVTADNYGEAKVWEAATGQELLSLSRRHRGIYTVAFSPDGRRLVTSGDGGTTVWDVVDGKGLLVLRDGEAEVSATTVAFSPDGKRILTGNSSAGGGCTMWDARDGRKLFTLLESFHPGSVAFSPDGQYLMANDDNVARLYQIEAEYVRGVTTFQGHGGMVMSVTFAPDGKHIATGSNDKTIKIWDITRWREPPSRWSTNDYFTKSAALSADWQRLVTDNPDRTATLWQGFGTQPLLTLKGHLGAINSVALSMDGTRIATGSSDQTVKVWDAASGTALHALESHRGQIWAVAFSSDGSRIVSASQDHTAKVWDTATGQEIASFDRHNAPVISAAFSPDQRWVVTGDYNGSVKIWRADNGEELMNLEGHSDAVLTIVFSPDGKRMVTGSKDQTARVWEVATGRQVFVLRGHRGEVGLATFSPDGTRIVTAIRRWGGSAKIWEASLGRELVTLTSFDPLFLSFSQDGRRLAAGSQIWEAASPEQVLAWRAQEDVGADYVASFQRAREAAQAQQRAERARDEGAIKQWLLLGPIDLRIEQVTNFLTAIDYRQIVNEGELRPRAGERTTVGGREFIWHAVSLPDHLIDFQALLPEPGSLCVAYAACYIRSEGEQRDVCMFVSSDDQAKVYLNGEEIYRCPAVRSFNPDQDLVRGIHFSAGLNALVFRVDNRQQDWAGSIRFTDRDGQPLHGIKVTLTPP